jgi:riboflavin synthase
VFTGLVQIVGRLRQTRPAAEAATLSIEASLAPRDRVQGASVAVAGVCLTVTASSETHFEADAAFETLSKTTLGRRQPGDPLNLEPALRVGDAIGGHLVSGHVDGVGRVRSIRERGQARQIDFDVPEDLSRFIAAKGSICVDGTSLTVNEVSARGFSVGLIPHTLGVTTLSGLAVGDEVNIEVDQLARYVARLLEGGHPRAGSSGGLVMADLIEGGFVGGES